MSKNDKSSVRPTDMEPRIKTLFDAAQAASKKAHAPYSNYHVGAALLADDGVVYAGCNVENVAYPLGSCAEAGALSIMKMGGAKRVMEVMIFGPQGKPCTPCGGCRQRLREFAQGDVKIHVANEDGLLLTMSMSELLPESFGPDLGQGIN